MNKEKQLIDLCEKVLKDLRWSCSSDNRPVNSYYGELFVSDMKLIINKVEDRLKEIKES